MPKSVPFCVLETPYVVWSDDVYRDRDEFLQRVDAEFYSRIAEKIAPDILSTNENERKSASEEEYDHKKRKDNSSLARLIWHHGIETLIMFFGAYIQTPGAVHAYFVKCKTEDAIKIAKSLLDEKALKYNRTNGKPFSIINLLRGIHHCTPWLDKDETLEKFHSVILEMLSEFASDEHRYEYNSIKHGLRASHGRFAMSVGFEEVYGVPPALEAMQTIGFSRDASFFEVARNIKTNSQSHKTNFILHRMNIAWSLEKVLCDLQLLSALIGNTVSALKIVAGAQPGTVAFSRPGNAEEWWKQYANLHAGGVPMSSFGIDPDAKGKYLPSRDDVFESYTSRQWKW